MAETTGTAKASKSPPTPTVHVVLDTNSLFTQHADKLISTEISALILEETKVLGAKVLWHLPAGVKLERRRQMLERGQELLGPIAKLERLLGHKLGMTEEVLGLRVDEAINREIHAHGLIVHDVDITAVDWQQLLQQAFNKTPPFSPTGEKGFKDAIILETFVQVVESLPRSGKVCRIVLLSQDTLLREAALDRVSSIQNATAVAELSELRTLLNAIASNLSQETVDRLIPKAKEIFWNFEKRDGLWKKWSLLEEIGSRFSEQQRSSPPGYKDVTQTRITIHTPSFVEKLGQKVIFSTVVKLTYQAYRIEISEPDSSLISRPSLGYTNPMLLSTNTTTTTSLNALHPFTQPQDSAWATHAPVRSLLETKFRKITRDGEHEFEVVWDVTLNSKGAISNPSLKDIRYKGVQWAERDVVHDPT